MLIVTINYVLTICTDAGIAFSTIGRFRPTIPVHCHSTGWRGQLRERRPQRLWHEACLQHGTTHDDRTHSNTMAMPIPAVASGRWPIPPVRPHGSDRLHGCARRPGHHLQDGRRQLGTISRMDITTLARSLAVLKTWDKLIGRRWIQGIENWKLSWHIRYMLNNVENLQPELQTPSCRHRKSSSVFKNCLPTDG